MGTPASLSSGVKELTKMGREKGSYPFLRRHAKKGYDPFSIRHWATRSKFR